MGYMKIQNLYKNSAEIFSLGEVWALEKIDGTSAHIKYNGASAELSFFSGCANNELFQKLFNADGPRLVMSRISDEHHGEDVTVYGEAYGGKIQGMRDTYGPDLGFVAFEVKIGDEWLTVTEARGITNQLGIEFVSARRVDATLEALDEERARSSVQAWRRGIPGDKMREGIVIRPISELRNHRGERVISKYKNEKFRETTTARPVDQEKRAVLVEAAEIAAEWVTEERLSHVLNRLALPLEMRNTGVVICAMVDDVYAESAGEVKQGREASAAIGKRAAAMYKRRVTEVKP